MTGGWGWGSCGGERNGIDDDIHFRNEERKKTQGWMERIVVVEGGRKSSSGGEKGGGWGGEKNCFAWLQSKRVEDDVFFFFFFFLRLRLATAVTDACACAWVCGARVFMCERTLSRGSSVSISRGRGRTWEKALVARKKQPAVLKQYQLRGNRQGDQSNDAK